MGDEVGQRVPDLVDEVPSQDKDLGWSLVSEDLRRPDRDSDAGHESTLFLGVAIDHEGKQLGIDSQGIQKCDGACRSPVTNHKPTLRARGCKMMNDLLARQFNGALKRGKTRRKRNCRVGLALHHLLEAPGRRAVALQDDPQRPAIDWLRHGINDGQPGASRLAHQPGEGKVSVMTVPNCIPLTALDGGQEVVELENERPAGGQERRHPLKTSAGLFEVGEKIEVHDKIEQAEPLDSRGVRMVEPATDRVHTRAQELPDACLHGIHDRDGDTPVAEEAG